MLYLVKINQILGMSMIKNFILSRRFYKLILCVSIFISAVFLIAGCLYIYFGTNGFSRELVAEVLGRFDFALYVSLALILIDLIWELVSPSEKKSKKTVKNISPTKIPKSKKAQAIQIVTLLIAVLLLVYGFASGGYADVLTKAVNICTECIGLG